MFKKIGLAFLLFISLSFFSYAETLKLKTYKPGEDIIVSTKKGDYRIKFLSIKETKDRNEFSNTKADKVVLIEFEYENLTYNGKVSISDWNFNCYDKDNYLLETYPASGQKDGSGVSQGRRSSGIEAYALNNVKYIELEYYDNSFNDKPDLKVIFEW